MNHLFFAFKVIWYNFHFVFSYSLSFIIKIKPWGQQYWMLRTDFFFFFFFMGHFLWSTFVFVCFRGFLSAALFVLNCHFLLSGSSDVEFLRGSLVLCFVFFFTCWNIQSKLMIMILLKWLFVVGAAVVLRGYRVMMLLSSLLLLSCDLS